AAAPAIIAFVSLECLVVAQAISAYFDHFLTVSQMQQRGINHGLPFVWHFGMWGDLLIVSPLAAYLIGRFFRHWRLRWMVLSLACGFVAASLLSWAYTLSSIPEAHVQNHNLTAAGAGHLLYMALALSVFIQFFLFTPGVPTGLLWLVSLLLLVHVFVGTHMALGVLKIIVPLNWYPAQPLKNLFGWITLATLTLAMLSRALFWLPRCSKQ
ncbi:MAG: hypothetical protein ACR2KT_14810, partial [Methylocella sp.]